MKYIIHICFFLVACISLNGQNQEDSVKGIKLNGNVKLFHSYYHTNGDSPRTSPWTYGIGGTLGITIGKYSVPINIMYQDHGFSLAKPFFYLGTSASFGNLNVHVGNRNTRFSKYTLGGATFFGVAAEYNVKLLRLGAMTGTFQNPFAQRDSIVYGSIELPNFNRKAVSAKIGFGSATNFIDLIVLKVKDDVETIPDEEVMPTNVLPKDNLVFGSVIQQKLFKKVFLKIDAAVSGLTYDLNYDGYVIDDETLNQFRDLLNINLSSNASYAGDIELRANFKKLRTSLLYRRVGPHFLSLGTNLLNSDREDYLFKVTGSLLDRKLTFVSSVGIQRTNLNDQRTRNTKRLINSLNLRYRHSKQLNLSLLFYNFDVESKLSVIEDNDSLKLVRVMNQFRVSPKYSFKTANHEHRISLVTSIRGVNSVQNTNERNSKNFMINVAYGLSFLETGYSLRLGLNTRRNNNGSGIDRDRYGLVLTGRKSFKDNQFNTSLNVSYFKNLVNSKNDGQTFRTGLTAGVKLDKSHQFNILLNYLHRASIVFDSRNDIQLRTSYAYNF